MAIKTTGVDHIHVLVPSLDSFLELFDRLFESEHTMQSEVESVQGFNSTLRFHDATSTPFLDVFEEVWGYLSGNLCRVGWRYVGSLCGTAIRYQTNN